MGVPEILRGRVVWIFREDHFDVDRIIGVENITRTDTADLVRVCMKEFHPGFAGELKPGDLLVGGRNFGYGHPHYQAMTAMRALGIAGVVAASFSPDFFRGEIAVGFPLAICPGIVEAVERLDVLEVDWKRGVVRNVTRSVELTGEPLPQSAVEMIEAGGLLPYLKRRRRPA